MSFLSSIKNTFSKMRGRSSGISISDIRPERAIYYFAYALELMLYAARGQFLPIGASVFGLSGWTVAYVAHVLASLIVMLLWSESFKPLIRISVAVLICGFIPFMFLPIGYPRLICGVVAYIGLGGAVTIARCGYAFAANNTERLFGMILMFFSVTLIQFVSARGADGIAVTYLLPLLLLAGLCLCLLRFREQDFEVRNDGTADDRKGLYWALAYFIAYFAIDGYSNAMIDKSFPDEYLWRSIGMTLAGILLLTMFLKLKLNAWHIWNLFFIFTVAMALFAVFAPRIGSQKPQYFFNGLSMIGWPLCIFTLGCAQRRFASYALLKRCTLIFAVLSPITTVSSKLVERYDPAALPVVSLVYILFIVVIFLILSPFSYKHLFSAVWISQIQESDMKLIQEKVKEVDRFGKYELSPRQRQIAVLLLAAKTGRQISGELGISASTVKMHTSELYRKLNINSRAELFRIFGVSKAEEEALAEQAET